MTPSFKEALARYEKLCSRHKGSVPFKPDSDASIENEMWIALSNEEYLIALFTKDRETGLVPHVYSYGVPTMLAHGKLLPMTVLLYSNEGQHVIAGGRLARPEPPASDG